MTTSPTPAQLRRLIRTARDAANRAYAPYSEFPVGAAILTDRGVIHAGCNVENASSGLGICAERSAVFAAVTASSRTPRVRCVVVYTPTRHPTTPCGACRQVLYEFGPQARVISICVGGEQLDVSLEALLPGAFGPGNLG